MQDEMLVRELFYLTAQQVKAQQRGQLRNAVWYRRAARVVGEEIIRRVELGTWHSLQEQQSETPLSLSS